MAQSNYQRLRQKYLDGIEMFRRKLEVLDEVEAEAEAEVQEPVQPPRARALQPAGGGHVQNGATLKYKGLQLTEALLQAVGELGRDGVAPPAIRDHLLKNGLETGSKHLLTSISTALARQVDKGNIRAEIIGNKRHYFPGDRTLFSEAK